MANQRATFGKRQRERDKQAKAAAKRERRAARADDPRTLPRPSSGEEQEAVLDELVRLHRSYEDGRLALDELEARREELRGRLHVE